MDCSFMSIKRKKKLQDKTPQSGVVQKDRDIDKSNQKYKYAFDNDYIHQTNIHIVTL